MNLSAINKATKGNTRTTGITDFAELSIYKVYANPEQPRKEFATFELMKLAHDIRDNGLLQPIVVVKREGKYMIVSGERRYRAHEYLQKPTIQAHIINADDDKVLELSLIENIQREDLSDFEIAMHIAKLWDSGRYENKRDLASAIGKSQSYISKSLGCLKLDEEIRSDLKENKPNIGLSVLEEISRVKEPAVQKDVYEKYKSGDIKREDVALARKNEVKEVEAKKPKYILKNEKYTKHGLLNYLLERVSHKLKYSKTYIITIEEI